MADLTWIEVADNAVKIGLGALIAGSVTIVTLHLNNKHSKNKELRTRTALILDNAIEDMDKLIDAWVLVDSITFNLHIQKDKGNIQDFEEKHYTPLREHYNRYMELLAQMVSQLNRILILQESSVIEDIRKTLSQAVIEVHEVICDDYNIPTIAQIKQASNEIGQARTKFSKEIRKIHQELFI